MATYFTSSNNQRDAAPVLHLREPLLGTYAEVPVLPNNMLMYVNSGTFLETSLASHQQNNCINMPSETFQQEVLQNLGGSQSAENYFNAWRDSRNEILITNQMGGQGNDLHGGQNLPGQGLSLTLSTQIPLGIQIPSVTYRNPNLVLNSFLSPNPSTSGERNGFSRDKPLRNGEFLPHDYHDSSKGDSSQYGMSIISRTLPNSGYLKAAQQLLDEVVNVQKALKQPSDERNKSSREDKEKCLKLIDGKSKEESALVSTSGVSSNPQESASTSACEASHAEKQDLQNKLSKLLSMLDEVDRRYKQYYHQMQIVVSSFDAIAGHGAAKPYTALALQTISRHFRCLRDAINSEIKATRRSLGDNDGSGNAKGGIARLRYIDQQLRQQRSLQQLGMMQQHAWRPQRGLPESSISILRAWLFEHFLHPYPKDSDKIMLARQTGLTRSQVSNWFINARVRLWKPMIEEMYKEETGDADMNSNSSSGNAAKATKSDNNRTTSEDKLEDLQQSTSSTETGRYSPKSNHIPYGETVCSTGLSSFQTGPYSEAGTEYRIMKQREEISAYKDNCNIFPDSIVQSEGGGDRFMGVYNISESDRFGTGNGISLTLGLQHCEGGNLPMSMENHHGFVLMRGDDMYNARASSAGESVNFECVNTGNQQERFGASHMYHDFVV